MKKIYSLILLLAISMFVVACGNDSGGDSEANAEAEGNETENQEQQEEETPAEIEVEHELDTTTVPTNPENVVVFDMGTLETLDELGVDVAAVPKENLPPHLSQYDSDEYKNAGTLFEPDFETLATVDPDLIIISGRTSEVYEDLAELAPTIYMGVDTENYMESFESNVTTLGQIFTKEDEAEQALTEINDSITALQEKADAMEGNGLVILTNEGGVSAFGAGSRFGIIHDVFGVPEADESIDVSTHGQNVSFEYLAETNPDYLFVIDRNTVVGGEASAEKTLDNELVNETTAAQNDQITYLDPYYWYVSGGGLTSVKEMVNEVSEGLE
ncbi:periplasmic binding protein [Gracilibacillus halophilus YIM-C55.5]|uniref:Periplasmic binding protein n=1 Tax=Gracilibacillus halophilus YIM-C55.5 TaxID=1308866 RepID=N4WQR9_9BACI|nr:siderophore ABC transporter substrate-binding protein [Gracilibacillus halophilus]ENH96800.1 periplasmic binding protein [Gracilibacillus halophilus YIM-C55.5]